MVVIATSVTAVVIIIIRTASAIVATATADISSYAIYNITNSTHSVYLHKRFELPHDIICRFMGNSVHFVAKVFILLYTVFVIYFPKGSA